MKREQIEIQNMKYTIGDEIFFEDKKCIIVATRETPNSFAFGQVSNIISISPEKDKDYLLFMGNQEPRISVLEEQIESRCW